MNLADKFEKQPIQFVFANSGMGDQIYWVTAVQYMIETYPHIFGFIVVKPYFKELANLWFAKYPRFKVVTNPVQAVPMAVPDPKRAPTPTGFHLLDCGFMYFANCPVPDGWRKMPKIIGNETSIKHFNLPKQYAVVVPGGTALTRTIRGEAVDEISEYLIGLEITPVYLGASAMDGGAKTSFSDFTPTLGIDLRDKTTTLEAACIMANAQVVVGIDGGLLHLAACSKVPLVFGCTIASPEKRRPYRQPGTMTEFVAPDIECIFCQEKVRLVEGYSSKKCFLETYACIKALDGKAFIEAIRRVL